ncbi:glycosyltransferase [Paenibacillus sp. FSL L8-0708]|uniref:glycosyltransferase n=1 Tax=Paenibacillus sp. FSL L8-0708 TaxID=2975311 RepID=UPI0030F50C22
MKKILIFINSMKPAGGIERVVANLANSWSEKYEITLLVKDHGESFFTLNDNIKIDRINVPLNLNMNNRIQRIYSLFRNLVSTKKKLTKYSRKTNFDYIYVTSPFNALEIVLLGKEFQRKLIISEHGSRYAYNRFYKFLKKIIYPKSYKISVPTTIDTKLYIEDGYDAIYIPHISTFEVGQQNQLDTKVVINIGRLTSDKQQLVLLKIWNEIEKKNTLNGWKLKIVGKGEEESKLMEYISTNNLESSVEIIAPQADVEKIYQQASLFAFTSKFEGFGMVLLEAMSFGIPCISFDCPSGPRDIIVDGMNGKLIPSYDLKAYEHELYLLLNNDINSIKDLGDSAFSTAVSWDNKKILEMWDNLFL